MPKDQIAELVRAKEKRWPKAEAVLANGRNDVLTKLTFPAEHRTRIYSTNSWNG